MTREFHGDFRSESHRAAIAASGWPLASPPCWC